MYTTLDDSGGGDGGGGISSKSRKLVLFHCIVNSNTLLIPSQLSLFLLSTL
jgi:hypothetical protein